MSRFNVHNVVAPALVLSLWSAAAVANAEVKASKESLYGVWDGTTKIDEVAFKKDEFFKKFPADVVDRMVPSMKEKFEKMTMSLNFNKDGTFAMDAKITEGNQKEEGTWEVVKTDGATITVKLVPKDDTKKKKTFELVLTHVDEKTLTSAFPTGDGALLTTGIMLTFTKK